jgi:hypothetical protein
LTLISNTLSNLPTYYLSLFSIPVGVSNMLERLQRIFYGMILGMSLNSFSELGKDLYSDKIMCVGS